MSVNQAFVPRISPSQLLGLLLCCLLSLPGFATPTLRFAAPTLRYEVLARHSHPEAAFTQGLAIEGDTIYEVSGLYNRSYVATWRLRDAKYRTRQALPASVFGEGVTLWDERVYVLSWREKRGFILDKNTLKKIGDFSYDGEGWGLTRNDRALIMSDGTARLRFLDPQTLRVEKTIHVHDGEAPVEKLNELEWIAAYAAQPARLLANIWQSDEIAVIDIATGRVTARIDMSQLYPKASRSARDDVLNGIAFDTRDQTLLITGKRWPYIYRIRLLDALP